MAGNYPDAPAYRLAYDLDGSNVFSINFITGATTLLTSTQKQKINNESSGDTELGLSLPSDGQVAVAISFPQPIDLVAYNVFAAGGAGFDPSTLQCIYATSTYPFTTNGIDGTWTNLSNWTNRGSTVEALYRYAPTSLSLSNITALRFVANLSTIQRSMTFYAIHLYANPHAGVARQLGFWHPTNNAEIGPAYFDWGDAYQSTSETRSFRIKNFTTYTASAVTISTNILTDQSPSQYGQNQLSLDGSTWSNSITLPAAIASGAISPVVYFRRSTASNSTLGVYAGRLNATAIFS